MITSFEDYLDVGSNNGCKKRIDPKSKTCIDIDKNLGSISAIRYSILYVGLENGTIKQYQLQNIKEFDKYDSEVVRIRNACNCRLYYDHINGCVTIWNAVTGGLLNIRYDYKTVIRRYFYYKDYLSGACDDGTIRIWNSNVCKAIIKLSDSPVIEMIMMYDYIYVMCNNGYITEIDNKAAYPLLSNKNHPITCQNEDNCDLSVYLQDDKGLVSDIIYDNIVSYRTTLNIVFILTIKILDSLNLSKTIFIRQ
ncbi:hypothetical protein HDU92_004704 [Lobulomyces angularis]|nr:hypothetical protein HDU92_004704 [Lobulomyces angularis]